MFLLLTKELSQKCNKYSNFNNIDKIKRSVFEFVQDACVVNKKGKQLIISFNSNTAKHTPSSSELRFSEKILNKNIILGNIGDVKLDLSSLDLQQECTTLDRFAQKLSADFAQKGAAIFNDVAESFCLVGSRSSEDTIHIAKDPLNSQSIYWIEVENCCMVSTDLNMIKKVLNRPLMLSERGLSSWLSGYPNPAISLFEEINVLPIGYRLELSTSNKAKMIKFWDIEPENTLSFSDQSEYSEGFLDLLKSSVANACASKQQMVASQMSGGLDSTSITALANDYLHANGKQLIPLSHMYTRSKKSDESQLVKDMLEFLKIDQNIQMSVDEGKDRDFLALYPTHLESPGTVLSPRYVKELALVKEAGADVLLTGNGGDEMCWGHSSAYTQRLKQGDLSVVKEVLKACDAVGMSKRQTLTNLFVKPFVPEIVLKILTLNRKTSDEHSVPLWLTDKAKSLTIEETKIANPFDKLKNPVAYNRYQSLKTTSTYNAVRSYEKVAQQFDINVRHPFFNTKIAEFTFAIPPKQLIQGPYPKWLLRNAMTDKLPDSVCWNLKKTTFDQHFGNLVRENASALREVLKDQRLAAMGLVNQTLLLSEFDRVVANPEIPLQVDLLYAILTFSWLNTHFPE